MANGSIISVVSDQRGILAEWCAVLYRIAPPHLKQLGEALLLCRRAATYHQSHRARAAVVFVIDDSGDRRRVGVVKEVPKQLRARRRAEMMGCEPALVVGSGGADAVRLKASNRSGFHTGRADSRTDSMCTSVLEGTIR